MLSQTFVSANEELPWLTTALMDWNVLLMIVFVALSLILLAGAFLQERLKISTGRLSLLASTNLFFAICSILIALLIMYLPILDVFEI